MKLLTEYLSTKNINYRTITFSDLNESSSINDIIEILNNEGFTQIESNSDEKSIEEWYARLTNKTGDKKHLTKKFLCMEYKANPYAMKWWVRFCNNKKIINKKNPVFCIICNQDDNKLHYSIEYEYINKGNIVFDKLTFNEFENKIKEVFN